MENGRTGCINRDVNGCKNIRKLFQTFMKDKSRPNRYCRGVDLTKKTNNSNPKMMMTLSCSSPEINFQCVK